MRGLLRNQTVNLKTLMLELFIKVLKKLKYSLLYI